MHIKANQPFQRKVSIAGALIGAVNTAVKRHHHTHGMFRHRFRRIGRYADDLNAQLFRRSQIDVIKAGATQCDKLNAQFGKLFQHHAAAVIINENADAIAANRRFSRFLSQQKIEKFQFIAVVFIDLLKVFPVVLFGTVHRKFHDLSPVTVKGIALTA